MTDSFSVTRAAFVHSEQAPTLPVVGPAASAGFGNHAEPYEEGNLNLHTYVVERPETTFFMRAQGDSMKNAGIFDGDLLVVDRSVKPRVGHIVIAVVGEDLFVKMLRRSGESFRLASANPDYPDVEPTEGAQVRIWGVVRAAVRQFQA